MKISKSLLLSIISFLFFSALDSQAQQTREMQPLEVHDFKCLQSLQCVENSRSLKSKGWSFIFDETVDEFAQELTARMEGKNISFLAIYDKQGNVIRSEYKRINVALPTCLLAYLTEGNYKGWKVVGSEMVMRDFDHTSLKYKVILENNTSARSEVFDFGFINDLHEKHKSQAKHSKM